MECQHGIPAMARSNMNPVVFVSMDSEGGTRSVFNGVQTYDGKGDIDDPTTWKPTNKGMNPPSPTITVPTNLSQGSAKHSTNPNLPVLIRNPNTQKIVAYHKNDQGDYEFTTQWDASLPTTDVRIPFLPIPI